MADVWAGQHRSRRETGSPDGGLDGYPISVAVRGNETMTLPDGYQRLVWFLRYEPVSRQGLVFFNHFLSVQRGSLEVHAVFCLAVRLILWLKRPQTEAQGGFCQAQRTLPWLELPQSLKLRAAGVSEVAEACQTGPRAEARSRADCMPPCAMASSNSAARRWVACKENALDGWNV